MAIAEAKVPSEIMTFSLWLVISCRILDNLL